MALHNRNFARLSCEGGEAEHPYLCGPGKRPQCQSGISKARHRSLKAALKKVG